MFKIIQRIVEGLKVAENKTPLFPLKKKGKDVLQLIDVDKKTFYLRKNLLISFFSKADI